MINRRKFLKLAGTGALTVLGSGVVPTTWSPIAIANKSNHADAEPDSIIKINAVPGKVPIFSGPQTNVWMYRGEVLKGDPTAVVNMGDNSYLGPVLRVNKGEKIRIIFQNSIPASSIIHWHGLHVPAAMDGHPRLAIPSGKQYTYEFQVQDRAGTYWYHPHPHGKTGHQVYGGLAGLFLIKDDVERNLSLPVGDFEIPLAIQDRTFNSENQLIYLPGGMMSQVNGMMGDTILVNGVSDFKLDVSTRVYRLRILNGSNARTYNLAWSDGTPITILGTDGGFLPQPLKKPSVMLGPGERLDVWADFTKYTVGDRISLTSLSFDDTASGMMGRGHMGRGMMSNNQILPNGSPFNIMQVNIVKHENEVIQLPVHLVAEELINPDDAINVDNPRRFELSMFHMHGLINGKTFQMNTFADDEIVGAGTLEIWEFINTTRGRGMMGMQIPHPMHLHGAHFQVLKRSGFYSESFMDEGWKDTVLLMPEEKIRLLVSFGNHPGLFLYHCHNLEHGDAGMMRNYYISRNAT